VITPDLDAEPVPEGGAEPQHPIALEAQRLVVPDDQGGQRLDRVLAHLLPSVSRTRLQALITDGHITMADGRPVSAKAKAAPGDVLQLILPELEDSPLIAQAIPLEIVHEDADLLVINKPVGLVVHPASGHRDGTLVNALLHHCGDQLSGIGGVRRPGIVHRLDKDTSGLMVVAKHDQAHLYLKDQFQDRTLSRGYVAVVHGVPKERSGRIEGNIGRPGHDRYRMAVLRAGRGKPAATRYERIEVFGTAAAVVRCKLETGRTHQVRVHMAHLGHPLVGDPLYPAGRRPTLPQPYRDAADGFARQALHAETLRFRHPRDGGPREFSAPIAADMAGLIARFRDAY